MHLRCLIVGRLLAAAAVAVLLGHRAAAEAPAKVEKIKEVEEATEKLKKGQVDEAYKLLQEAVKNKPDLPPARLMLARMFMLSREGQQQGRTLLELAISENPERPEVFLAAAGLAMSDGRVSDTILNCQKALELATSGKWTAEQKKNYLTEARGGLATAYEARKDWASTRTNLLAWQELDPKNVQVRIRLGQALFYLDKSDDAFAEFQSAAKDAPKKVEAPTVTMGRLWTAKGDFDKAREWLDKAIKAEPNSYKVQLAYADWLLQQNDSEKAKDHADAAAKLQPNDTEVLKVQGLIARIQKDMGTAEGKFRRILADTPGDFFAANQLALVLADQTGQQQRSQAAQLAELNARQYPRSAEALATLGYAYDRIGNLDGTLKVLQAAVSGGQASSDTAYYLALCLSEKDKTDDARKILKGALESKGLFVYRKEAQSLHDKLDKKEPAKPASP